MTYVRGHLAENKRDPDRADVSHSAELVRGDFLASV